MRTLSVSAWIFGTAVTAAGSSAAAAETHSHPPPEKLGTVHFETSCATAVRGSFDRAVALLHSFAYESAAREFHEVAARDAGCAMAHWGAAMSLFHQLWSPPDASELARGRRAP